MNEKLRSVFPKSDRDYLNGHYWVPIVIILFVLQYVETSAKSKVPLSRSLCYIYFLNGQCRLKVKDRKYLNPHTMTVNLDQIHPD